MAALLAALGWFAAAGQSAAAERAMTGEELRDIARRGMLWCETYHPATDDCDVVTLVRLLPDGRLAETSTMLIQEDPALQVFIGDTNAIDGDRLCSKMEADKTRFAFTIDGRPVPPTTAVGLRLLFMAQLAEFDGKTLCQAFFRDEEKPDTVREEITVDGKRRTDLESVYILHEPEADLKLRPQVSEAENARIHL